MSILPSMMHIFASKSHFQWVFELNCGFSSNILLWQCMIWCVSSRYWTLPLGHSLLSRLMLFNVPRHMTARGSRVGHKQQREKSQIKHSKCFCSPKDPFSCQEKFMFGPHINVQQWKLYLFYHSARCRLCWTSFCLSKTPLCNPLDLLKMCDHWITHEITLSRHSHQRYVWKRFFLRFQNGVFEVCIKKL